MTDDEPRHGGILAPEPPAASGFLGVAQHAEPVETACRRSLRWQRSEQELHRAHRLDPLPDTQPGRRRPDEALGFILIGEPADPDNLRVLDVHTDTESPMSRDHSAWVTPWSKLHQFFPISRPPHGDSDTC